MWKAEKHNGWAIFSQLVPLAVLFLAVAGIGFLGYQIYLGVNKIQTQATKTIGSKNITFTKEGLRVGVKHMDTEKYVDATQKIFVEVWNQHNSVDGRKRNSKSK